MMERWNDGVGETEVMYEEALMWGIWQGGKWAEGITNVRLRSHG